MTSNRRRWTHIFPKSLNTKIEKETDFFQNQDETEGNKINLKSLFFLLAFSICCEQSIIQER
jgi:hypothetical protein